MYYRSNTNKDAIKKKANASPIRVVIRLAWSGARLTVPTTDGNNDPLPPIRASSTTLLDLILRLESALPPSLFQDEAVAPTAATLVCLRKVVPQSQWEYTTLQQILDGDNGSAGVVLTLDLGVSASSSDGIRSSTTPCNSGSAIATVTANPITKAISSAVSSLNIKPAAAPIVDLTATDTDPRPMETANCENYAPQPHSIIIEKLSPEQAWNKILQSNFDSTSKDCLSALLKIIDNLLSRPNEPKVRSIRCANAAFEKKVGSISGGYEFLYSIGFVPKYPATSWHQQQQLPEILELTTENEETETLLRGRHALIQSAVKDFDMDEGNFPPVPKVAPPLVPPAASSSIAAAAAQGSNSRETGSTAEFNVYKAHSYNIQSAAMGAPDPYSDAAGAAMSITERQLQDLKAKKDKLERDIQSNIEMDRGLVACREGSSPILLEAAPASGATSGVGKSDSSLIAARMKRMEEERRKREEGGFTTKAMRDLEKIKKAKVIVQSLVIDARRQL